MADTEHLLKEYPKKETNLNQSIKKNLNTNKKKYILIGLGIISTFSFIFFFVTLGLQIGCSIGVTAYPDYKNNEKFQEYKDLLIGLIYGCSVGLPMMSYMGVLLLAISMMTFYVLINMTRQ
jgi:hypothetical protein